MNKDTRIHSSIQLALLNSDRQILPSGKIIANEKLGSTIN